MSSNAPSNHGFGSPVVSDAEGYGPWGFGDHPPGEIDDFTPVPATAAVAEERIYIAYMSAGLPDSLELVAETAPGIFTSAGTAASTGGDTPLLLLQRLVTNIGGSPPGDWTFAATALDGGDPGLFHSWDSCRLTATAKVAGPCPTLFWDIIATGAAPFTYYGSAPSLYPLAPSSPDTYPPQIHGVAGTPEAPAPDTWAGVPEGPGFGDEYPLSSTLAAQVVVVLPDGASALPDDGGELVQLLGPWEQVLAGVQGPYRVRLLDSFTGHSYPDGVTKYACHSGIAGQGTDCQTDLALVHLQFAMPVCPPGIYDVQVSYGTAWGNSLTLIKVLRVVRRTYSRQQWTIRAGLMPHWAAGARQSGAERLQGG